MKIICKNSYFKMAMSVINNITSKRNDNILFNTVLTKAEDNKIKLIGADDNTIIHYSIVGKIDEEGSFATNVMFLNDYINRLSSDLLTIKNNEKGVKIITDKHRTTIKTINEFSEITPHKINKDSYFLVNVDDLESAINTVISIVDNSPTKPVLNGAYFDFNQEKNTLIVASINNAVLAEKKIKIEAKNIADKKIVIPKKTLAVVLSSILALKKSQFYTDSVYVKIYITNNSQCCFSFVSPMNGQQDSIKIFTKLIEGEYPNYTEIIPTGYDTAAIIDKKELIDMVSINSIFSNMEHGRIDINFTKNNNKVIINTENNQKGDNLSEIYCKLSGQDNKISLNYSYVLNCLKNLEGDDIRVFIKDNIFMVKHIEKQDYIYLIMGLNV